MPYDRARDKFTVTVLLRRQPSERKTAGATPLTQSRTQHKPPTPPPPCKSRNTHPPPPTKLHPMPHNIRRPCLNCRTLTTNPTRCNTCTTKHNQQTPRPPRPHYSGNYKRRAKEIRDNATYCWICNEGPRDNDPFTADHLYPGDTSQDAQLLPAHRSCNSSRGNTTRKPKT